MSEKLTVFNLIYYKALLDKCFCHFFEDSNDMFIKQDGKYILCQKLSASKIQSMIRRNIIELIKSFTTKFDKLNPRYYIIIGACLPKDNILLEYKCSNFPKKLDDVINKTDLKYIMKEKDIEIDIQKFNYAAIDVFNSLFKTSSVIGKEYPNVIFLLHNKLDCYLMFKIFKHIYGKSNCTSLYDKNQFSPIVAVNDLIQKYSLGKTLLNRSNKLKKISVEVKQFIDEKIKECYCG